ncbi:hypothetical protein LWI29_021173 [Acer saccharum]|uniref:Uncharacterized protein n=1 Tax=Acer saccharum TaxID=4024 RepID=A0AA39RIC9_ACESA|nr:hypothetical protein LWI29_021173 [Acer saccharum]
MLEEVILWSKACLEEYKADISQVLNSGSLVQRNPHVWRPLCEGFYKINSDAALEGHSKESCMKGVGNHKEGVKAPEPVSGSDTNNGDIGSSGVKNDTYGPWMQVS